MTISFYISRALVLGISITILFIVSDVYEVLSSRTELPIIETFYMATNSKRATTAIVVALMWTSVLSTFGLIASTS